MESGKGRLRLAEVDFDGDEKTDDGNESQGSAKAPDTKIEEGHNTNGPKK